MSNRIVVFAAVAACAVSLSGCASIIKGSSQQIAIESPPATGASCELSNREGHWTVVTPGVAKVHRSKEDMRVTCAKDGWQTATAVIPSDFEGWTLGNLLIGGIIGLGVDASTGAINEYPHAFQVPMHQTTASMPSDTTTVVTSGKPTS
ncbi:MAG TPA: hypothetical protein VG889_16880 [Rhizomicrobium sp.]|nr:hypothetical protein [Rhizomicrobium sp.]